MAVPWVYNGAGEFLPSSDIVVGDIIAEHPAHACSDGIYKPTALPILWKDGAYNYVQYIIPDNNNKVCSWTVYLLYFK